MFKFLKRKPKASEDTEVFFACYQASNRAPVKLRQGNGKTQSDKFRERYKGVDPFNRMDRPTVQQPKQTKGKLNSTKKRRPDTTLHSLADLDVFCH